MYSSVDREKSLRQTEDTKILEPYFQDLNIKLERDSDFVDNVFEKTNEADNEDENKRANDDITIDDKGQKIDNMIESEGVKKVEICAKNLLDAHAFEMYERSMMNKVSGIDSAKEIPMAIKLPVANQSQFGANVKMVGMLKKKMMDTEKAKISADGLTGVVAAAPSKVAKKNVSKKFGAIAKNITKMPEKVLYARNNRSGVQGSRNPVTGGVPINEELATEMRSLAFGSAACPPRGEWTRTPITIRPPGQSLAYGLAAPRNGCRGLLAALGAHVLKHLLFGNERPKDAQGKYLQTDILLRPDETRQQEALVFAISEVIWRASGDSKKAFVALPQDVPYVQHSHYYYQDSITEKLHIFEVHNLEDLQILVKRYLYMFDEEPGCGTLLLLYACMLTRGLQNIKKDMDGKHTYLVSSLVEGSINIVMLLLTGRATPYLHNGVIYVGDEDHYALPQYGVLARSSIGLLEYRACEDPEDSERQPPGSRLKTPALPIWVTFYAGHFGMLFNTNRELLRNYHAERRFDLQYYTCGGCYVLLSVDTRALNDNGFSSKDDINATPLEKLIHTKWQDAKITWTGQMPYVGDSVAT